MLRKLFSYIRRNDKMQLAKSGTPPYTSKKKAPFIYSQNYQRWRSAIKDGKHGEAVHHGSMQRQYCRSLKPFPSEQPAPTRRIENEPAPRSKFYFRRKYWLDD